MPQLYFKRKFFDAIIHGRKTSTIRRWKACRIFAGDRIFSPHLGWLHVHSCEPADPKKLSESDAAAEGFASPSALRKALSRFYPNAGRDGKRWYRLIFSFRPMGEGFKWPQKNKSTWSHNKTDSNQVRGRKPKLGPGDRLLLVNQVRAELDKAVRQRRSLATL